MAPTEEMNRPRVLVVDDDPNVRLLVRVALDEYEVVEAVDADTGWTAITDDPGLSLVLLDVMMPGRTGIDLLAQIDEADLGLPVIMLTAKADDDSVAAALGAGAVGHLGKPFSPAVLEARVAAAIRSSRSGAQSEPEHGIRVDLQARRAFVDGRPLDLTDREFALLAFMAADAGKVFSREELLAGVWADHQAGQEALVTEVIRRIRSKVEPDPERPEFIVTVSGAGYRFQRSGPPTPTIAAYRTG
ncbi:MAG: response regulator transcription factor [Acidimicrobiales bacterium]